uniref:Calcineurin-like phosphoesterase domain-containing protein n=1 Tax=Acrobeloides nanus TaxID=290746 RepID=A0A914DVT7_9BILA
MELLSVVWLFLSIILCETKKFSSIIPEDEAEKILANSDDDLNLLFTGDPQYHFPCTLINSQCKKKSEACRRKNGLDFDHHKQRRDGLQPSEIQELEHECIRLESEFSNEVQRKSIFDLNRKMANKPKALIINGDLTNFGHIYQLNKFKEQWLTLPIPILAGLGNHDYENNVDDCVANQCANTMLYWFVRQYAKTNNLSLDYKKSNEHIWKTTYAGSFAYSTNICNDNETTCVHSIQLNNRPDYAASISSASQWHVHGSFQWLTRDLESISNRSWPVLINLHHLSQNASLRLKSTLEHWMGREENKDILRKVMVLYAHFHENHVVQMKCVGGVTIPYIFVGSVPNNRYTNIKFNTNGAEIFLLQSNANSTTSIMQRIDFQWKPC